MIEGNAPRLATVTAAVPAYASRSIGPLAHVHAYMGVPLIREDGTVFGTLCGFASAPSREVPRGSSRWSRPRPAC